MQISVLGCGFLGLVTSAGLAEIGHQVVAADRDRALIEGLKAGKLPFYEPCLAALLQRVRHEGRLIFTTDSPEAVRFAEALFLCVGAPQMENGNSDLSRMDSVARLIAAESTSPKLVIERSTVPVQTGQQLKSRLAIYGQKAKLNFRVASNPSFHREGSAMSDFFHPDRILIGVEDSVSEQQLREIYGPVVTRQFDCPVHLRGCPSIEPPKVLVASIQSAELIKHAANAFLGLKISYANLLANLCEKLNANVVEVTQAIGMDPRIGPHFLQAGLGFGGFRLPKDLRAFNRLAERAGIDGGLLKEAELINQQRVDQFFDRIRSALWVVKEKRIGLLGLAYKPNTDDIRFSPAIELARRLLAEGACVQAYDPEAMEMTRKIYPQIVCAPDAYRVAEDAYALLLATDWEEFRRLDWARIRRAMSRPLVFDGRNLLVPAEMQAFGFEYHSVGRPSEG